MWCQLSLPECFLIYKFESYVFLCKVNLAHDVIIVGTPTTLLKEGGRIFQKLSHLEGTRFFARKRGYISKGVLFNTLQFSSITFTLCVGKVRFPFLLFRSSVFWFSLGRFSPKSISRFSFNFLSRSWSKTWYYLYISDPFCTKNVDCFI